MKKVYMFIGLLISCSCFSQSGKQVFNDAVLHELYITITLPDWFNTLDREYKNNRKDPDRYPEIDHPCSIVFDGIKLDSVGIRERGNFSNTANTIRPKKPFKLSIDVFVNQKLDGLKNLNLNNGTDDPSLVREAFCYKLLRDEGVAASRTSYCKVYINGQYWGLYLLVENVDKAFLKDHFGSGNNDGNLYKTSRTSQAFLQWKGEADSLYIKGSGLEIKSNTPVPDWSRLIHFIDIINHTTDEAMKDSLIKRFNVDDYLQILATEKLVFSWDSYWGGGNNYYLYEHPDGKIYWIPWDFNETFSRVDDIFTAIIPSSSYLLPTNRFGDRPLLRALFATAEWQQLYFDKVCSMLNNKFRVEYIDTTLYRWHALIEQAMWEDTNKLYTFEAFDGSLTKELIQDDYIFPKSGIRIGRKLPGIIPFMQDRREWAAEQMRMHDYICDFPKKETGKYNIVIYPNPALQNTITLHWDEPENGLARIQLFNMLGQKVFEDYNTLPVQNSLTVVLPDLPSGMYMIYKLDASGKSGVGKWVRF